MSDKPIELGTQESMANLISQALESEDPARIAKSIGDAARKIGITAIAGKTGIARGQLYRSFSPKGNPTLKSVLAVMQALDLKLAVKVKSKP